MRFDLLRRRAVADAPVSESAAYLLYRYQHQVEQPVSAAWRWMVERRFHATQPAVTTEPAYDDVEVESWSHEDTGCPYCLSHPQRNPCLFTRLEFRG